VVAAPPAPKLTVLTGNGLAPRVLIELAGMDPSATTITVTRFADGEATIVRGAQRTGVSGSFTVVDFEAPFRECTYQARVWADASPSALGAKSTVTVTSQAVWVQDPLDPRNCTEVDLRGDSLRGIARTADFEKLTLLGRKKSPLQFFGLGGVTGAPFNPVTETREAARVMLALLDTAPVLIRLPTDGLFQLLPAAMYALLTGSGSWPGWVDNHDAVEWTLTADEVATQTLDVVIRTVTIQTYMDAFPTIADLMGAYETYADELANPPGGY
jgi:hypothetical protein